MRVDEQLTSPVHLTGFDYEAVFSQIVPICSVLYLAWSTSAVVFLGTHRSTTPVTINMHLRHAAVNSAVDGLTRLSQPPTLPPSRCFCWVPVNKFKADPLKSSPSITDLANPCSPGTVARSVGALRTTGNWDSTNITVVGVIFAASCRPDVETTGGSLSSGERGL